MFLTQVNDQFSTRAYFDMLISDAKKNIL